MTARPRTASSSGATIFALLRAVASYGVDSAALAKELGIDIAILREPATRVDGVLVAALMQRAIALTGDQCIGFRFIDYVHPTTYHALGIGLFSSSCLRDFFVRLVRYYSLFTTNTEVDWESARPDPRLVWRYSGPRIEPSVERVYVEGVMALVIKFIRMTYRLDYEPCLVEFMWPSVTGREQDYVRVFGRNLRYSSAVSAIYVAPEELDLALPAANIDIAQHSDAAATRVLARIGDAEIVRRVNSALISLLSSGQCTKAAVAKALNMSVRTLYDRLADAGTTYRELLTGTRQELAERYIADDQLSMSDAAYLLGFSDAAGFSRAFKRWTGQSPSHYRRDKSTDT